MYVGRIRQVKDRFCKLLEANFEILKHQHQYFKEISAAEFGHAFVPSAAPT